MYQVRSPIQSALLNNGPPEQAPQSYAGPRQREGEVNPVQIAAGGADLYSKFGT